MGASHADGTDIDAGAVYVFELMADGWSQSAKLVAGDATEDARFGHAVAISGSTAIIGAPGVKFGRGATYIFRRVGGVWEQTAKLELPEGSFELWFGDTLDLEGDRALVGTINAYGLGNSAYLFERRGAEWVQAGEFAPASASGATGAVQLSGDRAVVSNGSTSVRVFELQESDWVETATLSPVLPPYLSAFGRSVALDGDWLLVGDAFILDAFSAGSAYLFRHGPSGWEEVANFSGGEPVVGKWFGWAAAVSEDFLAIGAPAGVFGLPKPGSIHVESIRALCVPTPPPR